MPTKPPATISIDEALSPGTEGVKAQVHTGSSAGNVAASPAQYKGVSHPPNEGQVTLTPEEMLMGQKADEQEAPQSQQPGFFKSLGDTFGISQEAAQKSAEDEPMYSALNSVSPFGEMTIKPIIQAGQGLAEGAKRIGGELKNVYESGKEGNVAGVASHAISALPFIGPALDRMNEQAPATHPGESWVDQEKGVWGSPGVLGNWAWKCNPACSYGDGGYR